MSITSKYGPPFSTAWAIRKEDIRRFIETEKQFQTVHFMAIEALEDLWCALEETEKETNVRSYDEGFEAGWQGGFEEGYDGGEEQGYRDGYKAGKDTVKDSD